MSFWSFIGLASATDIRMLQEDLRVAREENEVLKAQMTEQITAANQEYMAELYGMLQAITQGITALQSGAELDRSDTQMAHREFLTAVEGARAELSNKLLESWEKREVSEKLVIQNLKINHSQGIEIQEQVKKLQELLDASGNAMTALRGAIQENASQQEVAFFQAREVLSNLSAAQERSLEVLTQFGTVQEQHFHDNLIKWKETLNEAKGALMDAICAVNPQEGLRRLDEDQRKMLNTLLETQNAMDMLPEMKEYLSMLWEVTKFVWVNDLLDSLEKEL